MTTKPNQHKIPTLCDQAEESMEGDRRANWGLSTASEWI